MKKFFRLSIFLTLLISMTMCCLAASVTPGINLLTGTAQSESFNNMDSLPSYISNASLADSPLGDEGKVLFHNKQAKYGAIAFSVDNLPSDRAYNISFKAYYRVEEPNGSRGIWLMKNATAHWQIAHTISGGFVPNNKNGWVEHSVFVDTFDKLTNTTTGEIDKSDINKFIIEWEYLSADTATLGEKIYIDDVSIVPAYLVTYFDEDSSVYKTEYRHIVGNTFTPEVTVNEGKGGIIGWSLENDGTVDESITMNNKDFSLYAVYDNATKITLFSDINLLDEAGASATIFSDVTNRKGTDNITVSYSVADGNDLITLTDNGDGTATVTSKNEGMSKIVCTSSDGAQAEIYILSEYSKLEDVEVMQSVVDMSAYKFEGNHLNSGYDETEQAYKFIKDDKIVKNDDGNGNVTYYTDGFMRITSHGLVDTSVYKYLLLTVKCDYSIPLQIRYYTSKTDWKTISQGRPSIAATNGEYVTFAIDMETGTEGITIQQFVVGSYSNSPLYIKDMRFSNIATLTPEKDEVRKVVIIQSPKDITKEGETAIAKACLFTNKNTKGQLVWKVSDTSRAFIRQIDAESVEIIPVTNGKVTITAYDSANDEICDSFTLNISGQREKIAVYDLRVLFWGASVTKHGPYGALDWTGNWGMAATSEDKDYVHRLVARLEEAFYPSKVTFEIVATGSRFDASISSDTNSNTDYSTHSSFTDLENAVKKLLPNIIMADNSGNLGSSAKHDCILNAYTQVYDMIYRNVPGAIVCSGYCHLGHRGFIEDAFEALGEHYEASNKIFLLNHYKIAEDPTNLAPEWLDRNPPQPGVASHWGDKGMDEVSKVQFNAIEKYIRTNIEPEYVYIPESIEITGQTSIKTEGGKITLTATSYPSDTTNDVIWSVDDERVATVNRYGVVTAVNNGTVTVRATSKYNDDAYDTIKVTVSGQAEVFSVTYDANTQDEVTGLPEKIDFAKGVTALSDKRPLRDCYTFVGWSTSSDSDECVTEVNVTDNTTVYAVWQKTEGFEFDGEYDEYFGYTYGFNITGGFHSEVHDGFITCICTGGEKVRFSSPKIDIENKDVMFFELESAYFDSASTIELTVYGEGDEAYYVYPLTSEEKTLYAADISPLDGKVTGFEIYVNAAPSDGTMFSVYIDYIRFDNSLKEDVGGKAFCFSDSKAIVSSKNFDNSVIADLNTAENSSVTVCFVSGVEMSTQGLGKNGLFYVSAQETVSFIVLNYNQNGRYDSSTARVYVKGEESTVTHPVADNVLTSYDKSSIRIAEPTGIRTMASVTSNFHSLEEVCEYGFIVTTKSNIEGGKIKELVWNEEDIANNRIIVGKAFSREEDKHIVYNVEDEKEFFTAVLTHIPYDKFSLMTPLVFRPYIKLSDGSYVYGAKIVRSYCEVAKDIVDAGTSDANTLEAAKKILDLCGIKYSEDTYIDVGDLGN